LKIIGIAVVAALAASADVGASGRDDHGNPAFDQLGRHLRQSLRLIVGKTVFDRDGFALDIAGVLETLTEATHRLGDDFGRRGV
jgi:hypothetical protein